MTITSALQNALSGLRATGRLAEVTSNNLANALTPGYGRQSVILSAAVTGSQGNGVQVDGVARALDPELTSARRIADGDLAESTQRFAGIQALERAVGTVEDEGSLVNRVIGLERSLRSLAETPESAPRRQETAEAAGDLAAKFNQISTETTRVRQNADAEISRRVTEVNTALKKIAQLNRQIQIFTASGRETASLIDERERLIDTVSQNVPIRESRRADGAVELRTAEGLPLASTTANQFVAARYGGLTLEVPGLRTIDQDVTPGGAGRYAIDGGAIAGLYALRDEIAPSARAQIDALAADLIMRTPDPAGNPDARVSATDSGLFVDGAAATGPFAQLEPPQAVSSVTNGSVAATAHGYSIGDLVALGGVDEVFRVISVGDAYTFQIGMADGSLAPLTSGAVTEARRVDVSGLAGRIALNPNVDPRAGGDPAALRDGFDGGLPDRGADASFLRQLLDGLTRSNDILGTPGVSGRHSLVLHGGQIAETLATARVSSEAQTSAFSSARETLAQEEAGLLGVDSDEELQRLIQIEQAYAANAQVIQTAARMLDELTEIS